MVASAALPTGEFSLHIGQSLHDPFSGPSYHSLRYDFKPASVNTEAPGSLTFGTDGQVSLDLLKKGGADASLAFSGYSEPYEDGLDCVAVFDGTSWTLQLLSGALKVQHVKGEGRATPPPQATLTAPPDTSTYQHSSSAMDAASTQAEADDWSARELSHEGSEMHLANGHAPLALQNDVDSSGDTESEEEEAEAAQQPMHTAAPSQPNGIAQQFMNGHAQHHSEAQLRQVSDSSKSEEEGEAEEEDAAEPTQEADVEPQALVADAVPMTDLERQFFANSQPASSESSDSSSESDQESLNAGSEDDDDDGLDHF